ncbi:MAG: hypothetical protein C0594_09955, partial [Marinilabiliales bacterium]
GNYVVALESFEEASKINPSEQYPKDKISELKKLMKEEDLENKKQQQFDDLLRDADGLYAKKEYEQAKSKYQQASDLKPSEQYPKDKISRIDQLLSDQAQAEAAAKAKEESYQKAIAAGDASFKGKQYDAAKKSYNDALAIKPGEKYPKDKISEIDGILADQAQAEAEANAKKAEEQYAKLISKADASFEQSKYEESKTAYSNALKLKPGEAYPTQKIQEIDRLMQQQGKVDEEYKVFLTQAFNAYKAKQYQEAIDLYKKALKLKPNESFPKQKIEEISSILDSENDKAAKEQQKERAYKDAIVKADNYFNNKDYTNAELQYKRSLTYKPYADYPQQKLKEIQKILKEAEESTQYVEIDFDDEVEKAKYLNELAKKYPEGVTKENYNQSGKKIKVVIVNRNGIATEFKEVKTSYGTFYFENGQSISSTLFYNKTKE